jgi:NhaA family Na+:H+ antiporter
MIYFAFNHSGAGAQGWAIPMATDIVFAAAVLTALGKIVPPSLKLFLLVLAIVDDIGAIFVIGVFYSGNVNYLYIASALAIIVLTLWLNRFRRIAVPTLLAMTALLWWALHSAGVQASIAGAIIGFCAPVTAKFLTGLSTGEKLESLLYPLSTFIIIPIFALANAGVAIAGVGLGDSSSLMVGLGVFTGLLVGKIIGIAGSAWLAVRSGLVAMPSGSTWTQVLGVSCVAAIGFTVAIFVAGLAFPEGSKLEDVAKLSILVSSIVAAGIGALILRRAARPDDPR